MVSVNTVRSYILTISLLIVGFGLVAWFYVSGESSNTIKGLYGGNLQVVNFKTLKPEKDEYLMCAPENCSKDADWATTKIYPVSRSKLSQALFSYTDNNATINTFRNDLATWQFDFTEQVRNEKFPHVITVQFIHLSPTASSLNIYSRSELKASKRDIHKERIERWLRFMESSLRG